MYEVTRYRNYFIYFANTFLQNAFFYYKGASKNISF